MAVLAEPTTAVAGAGQSKWTDWRSHRETSHGRKGDQMCDLESAEVTLNYRVSPGRFQILSGEARMDHPLAFLQMQDLNLVNPPTTVVFLASACPWHCQEGSGWGGASSPS